MMNVEYMEHIDEHTDVTIVTRVFKDMETYINEPSVVETALVAVWVLGLNGRNKRKLVSLGACKAILNAMKHHQDNSTVQSSACCAIKNLKVNFYDFVIRQNAGLYILAAMRQFPKDAKLQEHACSAIKTIGAQERAAEHLVEINAPILIRTTMKNHKLDERVQKAAASAVWGLCLTDKNKMVLWDKGLAHFIIEGMLNHPKMERLQEYGCGTIWTFGYPHCMMRISAHEAVLQAMSRFKKNKSIIHYGCGAIRQYAALKSNSEQLLNLEAPLVIIEGLAVHTNEPVVQEAGCMAIWSLGILPDNKKGLMEQGVDKFLIDLTVRYKKFHKIFSTACGAMTNLSTEEEHASTFLKGAAGESIVRGGLLHPKNLQVLQNSLCALRNFAFVWNNEQLDYIKAAGLVKLVEDASKSFPRDPIISRRAREILQSIDHQ